MAKFEPVNIWVANGVIFQIGVVGQMVWGWFGNAWAWSWICTWCAVIICVELVMYNNVVNKGEHAIKALYPIIIMWGFGFLGMLGFAFGSWSVAWWGLVAAAIGCAIVYLVDKFIVKGGLQ